MSHTRKTLTGYHRTQIAARAAVSLRTVERWCRLERPRNTNTLARIELALRELGLEHFISAEPPRKAA